MKVMPLEIYNRIQKFKLKVSASILIEAFFIYRRSVTLLQ